MLDRFYFQAPKIIGEAEVFADQFLLVENGKIGDITNQPDKTVPCIEIVGGTISSGLIDLHIHGRDGYDVMDGKIESLKAISSSLARFGVTGFLATTVTASWDDTLQALKVIGKASEMEMPGARVLGGYSEGLFFTNDHKGAHNEAYFLRPTTGRLQSMLNAAGGHLKAVALAPEIEGTAKIIEFLAAKGVKVMLGHTNATYDEATTAIRAGAHGGVHVFNGMRGIHHREPGCTGAVLLNDTQVEVIADGIHLHPAILKLICKLKPVEKITLISDCINAGGLSDGAYRLGETDVGVCDGIARTATGSLAGSTLTLDRAVHKMSSLADIDFCQAIRMASMSPAAFLGIENRTGSISVGKQADLAIFGVDGNVVATFVGGKPVFSALPEVTKLFNLGEKCFS